MVDLEHTDRMDSSAMGVLPQLRDCAAKGRATELVAGSADVLEILHTANFDMIFPVACMSEATSDLAASTRIAWWFDYPLQRLI